MITPEFLITALIVVLIPGTGVIYTVSAGLACGRRASLFAALGCTAGIVPHLMATIFGLAAIVHSTAFAFHALRYAGAAYLLYLAYATWRDRSGFAADGQISRLSDRERVVEALLINILNPKLTLFFFAFIPQFVSPNAAHPVRQLLALSAVFMTMTFVVFVTYGALAHAFRRFVIESARVQNSLRYGFAATFAALGIRLASSER